MILSHAAAVQTYRTKYQRQGGSIGMVINAVWYEPFSNSTEDELAAERALSFYMNWFLDPIIFGKYPEEMCDLVGPMLPVFTEEERDDMILNNLDFIGINHYTSFYSKDCMYSHCESGAPGVSVSEGCSLRTAVRDGQLIGESTSVDWLYVYPQGMEKIVTYIKERYNNTPMFVTENGLGLSYDLNSTLTDFLNDSKRVEYMSSYLESLATAMRKSVDVRGYFAWSLLDNFEWLDGFTVRFGLHHVDLDNLERTPRSSASWYKQFIQTNRARLPFGEGLEIQSN